jgi:hypothetical protein
MLICLTCHKTCPVTQGHAKPLRMQTHRRPRPACWAHTAALTASDPRRHTATSTRRSGLRLRQHLPAVAAAAQLESSSQGTAPAGQPYQTRHVNSQAGFQDVLGNKNTPKTARVQISTRGAELEKVPSCRCLDSPEEGRSQPAQPSTMCTILPIPRFQAVSW